MGENTIDKPVEREEQETEPEEEPKSLGLMARRN